MDKLKSLFSLKNINNTNIEIFFNEIAFELFEHYSIKFGNITYKFLEIECYYWSDKHKDNRADGNTPFVYKRINEIPCAFLSHGSGMDICFKSTENQYGGILIRALKRIVDDKEDEATVIPGPWDCRDTLINYSGGMIDNSSIEEIKNAYPILTYNEKIDTDVEIKRVPRYGVPIGSAYERNLYCYYNHKFKSNNNKWGNNEIDYPRYLPTTQTEEKNKYFNVPWNRSNNNK